MLRKRCSTDKRRMTNDKSLSEGRKAQLTKVRKYDLDVRTHEFSKAVRRFVQKIPKNISNIEDMRQLIRSSGSVCANYLEASSAISKKDFLHRIKICRKEAKESWHWLDCIDPGNIPEVQNERGQLLRESFELIRIFSASIRTLELQI